MKRLLIVILSVLFLCALFQFCSDGDDSGGLEQIRDSKIKDLISSDNNLEDLVENEDADFEQLEDVGIDICVPDCSGKQCGDNGCGGLCGECGKNAECLENQCRCINRYDNCNSDWADGCEVNFYTDPKNCGKCGGACDVDVKNVKNVLCEDMICTYDECLPPYIDGDFDRKNGCEMYFYWPFKYGTVAQESGRSVIETEDKGFVIAGTTNLRGSGNTDYFIVKTDAYGNIIWQRILGGDKEDFVISVVENNDGDLMVGGYSNSSGSGGYDIWLVLFDATGNIKWQKSYGSTNDDKLFAMKPLSDGFIIAGSYNASCPTCSAIWVFKIDKNGDFVWQKQVGGNNDSGAYNLDISVLGEVLIAGAINTGCQTCYDALYIRLDKDGNRILSKQIGYSDNIERGYGIVRTSDDGVILAGEVPITGSVLDVFLMKFDKSGGVIWQRTYGGPENQKPYQIISTTDNNYLLLAETMFYGKGQYDCLLIKTDALGNALFQKTYGGDKIDRCFSVFSVLDGGYVFAGESYSFDSSMEMVVFRTDKDAVSKGVCPDGFGKSVSLKINNSSIPVKDLNIQVDDTSAAVSNTNAYRDISGILPTMLCKEK